MLLCVIFFVSKKIFGSRVLRLIKNSAYREVKKSCFMMRKRYCPKTSKPGDNIFFVSMRLVRIGAGRYSITTSGVSSMTLSPCLMQIAVTLPSFSASMLLAIFMASSTTTVSPAFTSSPT